MAETHIVEDTSKEAVPQGEPESENPANEAPAVVETAPVEEKAAETDNGANEAAKE